MAGGVAAFVATVVAIAGAGAGARAAGSAGGAGLADDFIVVRGGASDVPPPGQVFSGAYGKTLNEAASGVPHGQIRATIAGQIRSGGEDGRDCARTHTLRCTQRTTRQ